MLTNLMARLSSRENVLAALAQGAVTWGSNHLAATIATQGAELDELRAEFEQSTKAFVELALERDALAAERDELRYTFGEYLEHDVDQAVANARAARGSAPYPAAEDLDPLDRAAADEPKDVE